MDTDVLLQPPILYLVLVMLWWGVLFVPSILGDEDHFMVGSGAVIHLIIYSWLVHLSVPEESWLSIVRSSVLLVLGLTIGGYLLRYLQIVTSRGNQASIQQESMNDGYMD